MERPKRYVWSKGFSYGNIYINFGDVYIKFYLSVSLCVFVQYIGTVRFFKRKFLKSEIFTSVLFFKALNNYERPFLYVGNFLNGVNFEKLIFNMLTK